MRKVANILSFHQTNNSTYALDTTITHLFQTKMSSHLIFIINQDNFEFDKVICNKHSLKQAIQQVLREIVELTKKDKTILKFNEKDYNYQNLSINDFNSIFKTLKI